MNKMKIVNIKISQLRPAEYNPRKDLKPGDSEYEKLKKSLTEFGLVEPLVVNKDMTVIGGHQRLKVLGDTGHKDIPCVIVDLDKEHEKALNIALNKISGGLDNEKLADLLKEINLSDLEVEMTGFDMKEMGYVFKERTVFFKTKFKTNGHLKKYKLDFKKTPKRLLK